MAANRRVPHKANAKQSYPHVPRQESIRRSSASRCSTPPPGHPMNQDGLFGL